MYAYTMLHYNALECSIFYANTFLHTFLVEGTYYVIRLKESACGREHPLPVLFTVHNSCSIKSK